MRVLLVHSYYRERGGEDEVFDREAALLESRGVRVERFTAENSDLESLPAYAQAANALWNSDASQRMQEAIERFLPDIIHVHNSFPALSPSTLHAVRGLGVPVVMSVHNYRLACANGLFYRAGVACEECVGRSFAWPALRHRCYRGSLSASAVAAGVIAVQRHMKTEEAIECFIAPSHFAACKLEGMGISRARIRVLPHVVPEGPPQKGDVRKGILYAGRLSEEKGFRLLLRAQARLDESHQLTIAGDGPLAELAAQAAKVDARIRWLGRISTEALQQEMQQAVAVVVPSLCYETFGLVAAESFASTTPVIAPREGAIGELVEDAITGLHVETANPSDLAEKIRWALAHEDEMRAMGRNAYARYQKQFMPDAHYSALMALYEEVAGHATRQAA